MKGKLKNSKYYRKSERVCSNLAIIVGCVGSLEFFGCMTGKIAKDVELVNCSTKEQIENYRIERINELKEQFDKGEITEKEFAFRVNTEYNKTYEKINKELNKDNPKYKELKKSDKAALSTVIAGGVGLMATFIPAGIIDVSKKKYEDLANKDFEFYDENNQ